MKTGKMVVTKVIDYIDSNIEEDFSMDDIAGTLYFNRYYLMKLFKKETGLTITQYRNYRRIKSSMEDLLHTEDKILKIALNHGFHSLEYYSETFYQVVGMSPLQFRKARPSFLLSPREDEKMTRLEQIQKELEELKKLRSQVIGEEQLSAKKIDPPKVLTLRGNQNRKAA